MTDIRRAGAAALTCALALTLAACTGGEEGTDAPPTGITPAATPSGGIAVTACDLLTATGVREATKKNVRGVSNGPTLASNVCYVELGRAEQIVLSVYTTAAAETFRGGGPGEPVKKLGDEAKWLEEARTLVVRRGGTTFTLSLLAFRDTQPEDVLPQAVALSGTVLARLDRYRG